MDLGVSDLSLDARLNENERHLENWTRIAGLLLKGDSWVSVIKALHGLPDDIVRIYNNLEEIYRIKIDVPKRKLYYRAFFKAASGFGVLKASQVEVLVISNLQLKVDRNALKILISKKLELGSSYKNRRKSANIFDFELFASLVFDILIKSDAAFVEPLQQSLAKAKKRNILPIDPDSGTKTIWDLVCLSLLLYCSFEVPYTIAFDDGGTCDNLSAVQIFDLVVNAVFIADIAVSFVSSYEKGGIMIRDFSSIMKNYLRSWFLIDLSGSFPFDSVLCTISSGSMQATNLIRLLRFTRVLRLVRAIKFLAKLNSLRQHESFEGLGWAFGVIRAGFLLCIAAHMLGCLFTAMAGAEPDINWLVNYDPAAPDRDNWSRYVIALYWASVSLTTMGYGDIVPVTHTERLFAILVAFSGAVVFSYCIGTISSLVSKVTGADERLQTALDGAVELLQFRDIPPGLKRRIKSHFTVAWRASPELYKEQEILDRLSAPLRTQVCLRQPETPPSQLHLIPSPAPR